MHDWLGVLFLQTPTASQSSMPSQTSALAHDVPTGAKPSGGQAPDEPVHLSATSHAPLAARQIVSAPIGTHDPMNPNRISLVAPHGGHPHAFAPKGHYMLFAVTSAGIPSVGKFLFLH